MATQVPWPGVAALGVAVVMVGLVSHRMILIIGALLCIGAALGWSGLSERLAPGPTQPASSDDPVTETSIRSQRFESHRILGVLVVYVPFLIGVLYLIAALIQDQPDGGNFVIGVAWLIGAVGARAYVELRRSQAN